MKGLQLLLAAWMVHITACSGEIQSPVGGALGEPCRTDQTCNEGLVCDGEGTCIEGPDPCANVSCSGHGVCAVVGGDTAVCACEAGYHAQGLACLSDADPCDGVTCSGHGTCSDTGGTAACDCDAGYHVDGLDCVADGSPCDGVTCSGHGTCSATGGTAECNCDAGYHAVGVYCVSDSPSADLCDGLVADKTAHPMTAVARPAVGESIVDPEFGTVIRRITAVSPSEGENAVIKPMYSAVQAFNADESYFILWHRGAGHELYDGDTYDFVRELDISPTDIEQVLWDPVDPDVLYFPTNYNAVPDLKRYRVSTNSVDVVRNFEDPPASCPTSWSALLSLGSDPQYMSWGPSHKIVGLQCGTTKFLYDIAGDAVLGTMTAGGSTAPVPGASGGVAYFDGAVYDATLSHLRDLDMASSYEHGSVGGNASGHDVYNTVAFDDDEPGSLVSFDLGTGARSVIVGPSTGYPYPPSGTHLSSLSTKNPGWVAVSIVGDTDGSCVLCQEVLLAKPETDTVCRVGHHRSRGGDGSWGYWAEPHNVISPAATRILFGSDWGLGDAVDTYVIELPAYP